VARPEVLFSDLLPAAKPTLRFAAPGGPYDDGVIAGGPTHRDAAITKRRRPESQQPADAG